MARRPKPLQGNYPEGLQPLFETPIEHSWGIELRTTFAGKDLAEFGRVAIQVAQMNSEIPVMMRFNGIDLWVEPNDSVNHLETRYREEAERKRTPEQRAGDAAIAGKIQAKRTAATDELDRLYEKTPYKFPDDFEPNLSGGGDKIEQSMRRQIGIMAQWFERSPARRNNVAAIRRKINSLDDFGHSGRSSAIVVKNALAIVDKGFEPYLAELRERSVGAAIGQ